MVWESPVWLWFLLIIPVLIGISGLIYRIARQRRSRYFSDELFGSLLRNNWEKGNQLHYVLVYAGLALLIVALAGPKIGTEIREVKREGVDLMIALDLSRSMKAQDVRTNRLEKAKFELGRLVDRLQGDRIGLIGFTGESQMLTPFTLDYSVFRIYLDIADPSMMPSTTTNFQPALEMAYQAFKSVNRENSNAARVLLFVSDGEDHGPGYEQVLRRLIDMGVYIYTVGIGTEEGGNIPVYDENSGQLRDFLRDREGRLVTTRLTSNTLRDLAGRGGGSYFEINRSAQNIDGFINILTHIERGEFSIEEIADYRNQFQYLAFPGLLLLIIAFVLPRYKKIRNESKAIAPPEL